MAGTAFVAPQQKSPATEAEQDLYSVLRALVGSLNGETAFQRLINLTGVDDDSNYAVTIQNGGTGGHLTVPGIMDVTPSGVVIGVLSLTTLTVAGVFTANGAVNLGNASGDVITVTGTPTFSATATFNGTLRATSATLLEGTVMLGDAVGDTVTINGATTLNADLTMAGTGRRILGDLSDATVANRLLFQNSVVNGASSVSVIPNGTAVISDFSVYNASNPAAASFGLFRMTSTDLRIVSSHAGASFLPILFFTDATERMRIAATTGLVTVAAGLTVTAGGATVTAGGVTVTAGGLSVVAGGATIAGTLTSTGGIVISGPNNIDGNGGTAGELRIGAIVVNLASLTGAYNLEVNGDFRFVGNGLINGGVEIDGSIDHDGSAVGFFGTAPAAKPTIAGSRGANVALASLINGLVSLGLITDSTTI